MTRGRMVSGMRGGRVGQVCGVPRVCMRMVPQRSSAQVADMAGSQVWPLTSLTISAPASMAARAVAAWWVSMERMASGRCLRMASMVGMVRDCSSAGEIRVALGRVDSPPRSRMSAPSSRGV